MLGLVWPSEGKIGVTEHHVEFSHLEGALGHVLDHETSPGTKQVGWSNLTARGVASLSDHTTLVLLTLE